MRGTTCDSEEHALLLLRTENIDGYHRTTEQHQALAVGGLAVAVGGLAVAVSCEVMGCRGEGGEGSGWTGSPPWEVMQSEALWAVIVAGHARHGLRPGHS